MSGEHNRRPLPSLFGGRYRVESVASYELDATVFRARDLHARRSVLVVVSDHAPEADAHATPTSGLLLVRHPGLARVLDTQRPGEPPYLVLEVPQGRTLAELMAERGRYTASEFTGIGSQLLLAVAHLHKHGLVHRNLTADNIWIDGDSPRTARVTVAGLHTCVPDGIGVSARTAVAGATWHDVAYADARDDVFELGILFKEVVDLDAPAHADLRALCNRCLAERIVRPESARELLDAFLACSNPGPHATARRPASVAGPSRSDPPVIPLPRRRRAWISGLATGVAAACLVLVAAVYRVSARGASPAVANAASSVVAPTRTVMATPPVQPTATVAAVARSERDDAPRVAERATTARPRAPATSSAQARPKTKPRPETKARPKTKTSARPKTKRARKKAKPAHSKSPFLLEATARSSFLGVTP